MIFFRLSLRRIEVFEVISLILEKYGSFPQKLPHRCRRISHLTALLVFLIGGNRLSVHSDMSMTDTPLIPGWR